MAPEATYTSKQGVGRGSEKNNQNVSAKGGRKTPKQERRSVMNRPNSRKERTSLKDTYEEPVSGRELWWRKNIRETPVPGTYDNKDFLEEFLERKPMTYSFKSEGRKRDLAIIKWRRGDMLMPGAYEHSEMVKDLDKSINTYSFRNTDRYRIELPGQRDKECNVCPTTYGIENHLSLATPKMPSKHSSFKSTSSRFPTIYFRPNSNPGPGQYESKTPRPLHAVSSSFKSGTPRFRTSHTKVPGPGSYEKTYQTPMPSTIAKMGRVHGLFFTSAFHV
ncbi:protein STPG4-like [Saccoglossus kowalevskii]|uniref:Uncharacterized protein C2orf61 homolog n=1 Tax=Saccoglossus kowalevskii TaxID=10224 RepID=A0ABM0GMT0_SACKO|nr:PREDICTED: uncharacterized protein C2orf61 homolog [Saccoglossus kowalevskii]